MNKGNIYWTIVFLCLLGFVLYVTLDFSAPGKVSYTKDVKPILNKHCITCHGGVKKQGKFSLLFQEEAYAVTASGKPSIVPFHPEKSPFIARLHSTDPEEKMPYRKEGLNKQEIELLTQWVKEGAKWEDHWAYLPIKKPVIPSAEGILSYLKFWEKKFVSNPIDQYVLAGLQKQGMSHADQAEKSVLLRRLVLDLTGLPPTDKMVNDFQEVDSKEKYAAFVDQLMAQPSFGEKWASVWLDLSRYSDSRGYQKDNGRTIWPYRDWVIRSFNQNLSFRDFVTKQLAGDLLPNPTDDDYIATGFHRNTMNNDETGTVDEEFRVAAVIDRVNTTWDALHGTSFSCVQCHSHPYDPIRHDEYYKFMAFLNNTRDEDTGDEAPNLRKFKGEDLTKLLAFDQVLKQFPTEQQAFYDRFVRFLEPRFHAHYADNFVEGALLGGVQIGLRHSGTCRLPNLKSDGIKQIMLQYSSKMPGGILQIREGGVHGKVIIRIKVDTTSKAKLLTLPWPAGKGRKDYYLEALNAKLAGKADDVFRIGWFALLPEFSGNTEAFAEFKSLISAKTDNFPIYLEMPADYQRDTYVFTRGNWLMHGDKVSPDVPKFMHGFKKEWPRNRLGLAKWIIDPGNPLFARNVANRFWEQLFGMGIVETLEDFGSQGAKPSHQELLDYMAYQFIHVYDMKPKELIKEIVCSSTYQQDSKASKNLVALDPYNKWLGRGPRFRLSAEQVRDQALAVSGLLNPKMYGKPVMPYQPDGVWQAVNSSLKWEQSEGAEQYRRAIYVFTRRTGPYPSQFTFDSPSREVCLVRRIRTNTPLQALVLLNDPVFVEIAKKIALDMSQMKEADTSKRISAMYQKMFVHEVNSKDLNTFMRLFEKGKLLDPKNPRKGFELVATSMLNLDEFVTKL